MRTWTTIFVVLAFAQPARADVGFALQPALGIGTTIQPAAAMTSAASSGLPQATFTLAPILRLGVNFRPVAFLASFSYSSAGTQGLVVNSFVRIALDTEWVLWRAADDRTRIYALIGVGALVAESGIVNPANGTRVSVTNSGATLSLGFGGMYAVHPNFSIGMELAARPDFFPLDNVLYVDSEVYVALTGTFVTGRRHF